MRTLTVLAAISCLVNTATMALSVLTSDPVSFWITYLNASGTGYAWLAFRSRTG
jgi:hypothetical protein